MLSSLDNLDIKDIQDLLKYLDPHQLDELHHLIDSSDIWTPLPGPQVIAYTTEADIIGFGGAAGGGKLLRLSEKIPTPDGFVRMGEISVGDQVIDETGNKCNVVALSEIDREPCLYEFTFDDGSSIVSCVDHQWVTFDSKELTQLTRIDPEWRAKRRAKRHSRAKEGTSQARLAALSKHNAEIAAANTTQAPTGSVRTTQEIVNTLLTPKDRKNHAIKLCKPLNLPEQELLIHPYVFGCWLGDGTSVSSDITGIDDEMWNIIESHGYTVRHSKKCSVRHTVIGLRVMLIEIQVLGNKHIPQNYLRGSRNQRLELLRGLMDTDGTVAKHSGSAEFCNTNERIIDGVYELICSLGWKVRKREGKSRLNGRECGKKWTLKFVPSDYVFNLPRKRTLQKIASRRTTQFRYIVSATPVLSEPGRCISVDSKSRMYLVGDSMIPTHNSDLAIGKAITQHERTIIFRREATQLTGIIDRLAEIVGHRVGYNGQEKVWREPVPGKQIELGSVPNLGDETKYQGRPHDFIVFDEAANFLEYTVRFLLGWLRTTTQGQKCQALLTFNPPTTAEGRWVIDYFAPWLDPKYPGIRALPGELRYAASIPQSNGTSKDLWVDSGKPFVLAYGEPLYEFDEGNYQPQDIIKPMSRTFIPSKVSDNTYLVGTGYMSQLQALPEPLRSQMLNGDFMAGVTDDPWQVIPTEWVDMAMDRWTDRSPKGEMDSMGVDVARGGQDQTILSRRHGMWFDMPLAYPGKQTPDGPAVAGLVIAALRDNAPIHLDVIGVGSSPYDFLVQANQQITGVNVSEKAVSADGTPQTDKTGRLSFMNQRSMLWWLMREALDPAYDTGIALPPVPELKADLCAPRWSIKDNATIKVESREDIYKRIGRSPDYGSAFILALIDTPKVKNEAIAAFYQRKRSWRV